MSRKASSAVDGFFQEPPILPPQFTYTPGSSVTAETLDADDRVFSRILKLHLSPEGRKHVCPRLHDRARLVLDPSITRLAVDAEQNPPYLRPLTTFGKANTVDALWTSEAWKELKRNAVRGHTFGRVYERQRSESPSWNLRIEQHIGGHLVSATDALVGCPMSMTDGAATLLTRHLDKPDGDQPGFGRVVNETFRRLISNDPAIAWTTGQWMTERPGGSDISNTETVAKRLGADGDDGSVDAIGLPLGPWSVDGFKWFSSATDCEVTVLLAQTDKGISAFLCPTRRRCVGSSATEPNGIRIVRLKNKLGTKALPTAELDLKGTRGWLIGKAGEGVKEIAAILNTTRMHTGIGSCATWGRSLAVSRAFSRVRRARGVLLQDNPVHVRWMAAETVKYTAAMHLTYFGSGLLGASEQGWDSAVRGTVAERLIPKDMRDIKILLRMLTPVLKSKTSVGAVHGVRECLESLGGVGYCENDEDGGLLNIARLFRNVNVNPVWEGTVSVMGEDIVRVITASPLTGFGADAPFARWLQATLGLCTGRFPQECEFVRGEWQALIALTDGAKHEQLLYHSRSILTLMETVICSCLLMFDSLSDDDEVATASAKRWIASKAPGALYVRDDVHKTSALDRLIFMGSSQRNARAQL